MKELPGLAKAGHLLIGLLGGFPGVLLPRFVGKSGRGWSEGRKKLALICYLLFVILSIIMTATDGLLVIVTALAGNASVTVS